MQNKRCGKGLIYIQEISTNIIKRWAHTDPIPAGWSTSIKRSEEQKEKYTNINKNSFFVHDPVTKQIKRLQQNQPIPDKWVLGRPKQQKNG
jgi:hypothetical protein